MNWLPAQGANCRWVFLLAIFFDPAVQGLSSVKRKLNCRDCSYRRASGRYRLCSRIKAAGSFASENWSCATQRANIDGGRRNLRELRSWRQQRFEFILTFGGGWRIIVVRAERRWFLWSKEGVGKPIAEIWVENEEVWDFGLRECSTMVVESWVWALFPLRGNAGVYVALFIGPPTNCTGQKAATQFALCTFHATFHRLLSVRVLARLRMSELYSSWKYLQWWRRRIAIAGWKLCKLSIVAAGEKRERTARGQRRNSVELRNPFYASSEANTFFTLSRMMIT